MKHKQIILKIQGEKEIKKIQAKKINQEIPSIEILDAIENLINFELMLGSHRLSNPQVSIFILLN